MQQKTPSVGNLSGRIAGPAGSFRDSIAVGWGDEPWIL